MGKLTVFTHEHDSTELMAGLEIILSIYQNLYSWKYKSFLTVRKSKLQAKQDDHKYLPHFINSCPQRNCCKNSTMITNHKIIKVVKFLKQNK